MENTENLQLIATTSHSQHHDKRITRRAKLGTKQIVIGNPEMFNEMINKQSNNVSKKCKNVQHSKLIQDKLVTLAICKPLSVCLTRLSDTYVKRLVNKSTKSKRKKRRGLWRRGVPDGIRKKAKLKAVKSQVVIGKDHKDEENVESVVLPVDNTTVQFDRDNTLSCDVLSDERSLTSTAKTIPSSSIETVKSGEMSGNNEDLACDTMHNPQQDIFHAKQRCMESQDAEYPSRSIQHKDEYSNKWKFKRKRDFDVVPNAEKEKQSIIIPKKRRRKAETTGKSDTVRRLTKFSNRRIIHRHKDKIYSYNRKLLLMEPKICLTRLEHIDDDSLIKKWKLEKLKSMSVNMSDDCSKSTGTMNDFLDLNRIAIAERLENTKELENIIDNRNIQNVQNMHGINYVEDVEGLEEREFVSKETCNSNVQERDCTKITKTLVRNAVSEIPNVEANILTMDTTSPSDNELINKHKLFKNPKVLLISLKSFDFLLKKHYSSFEVQTLMDKYMDYLVKLSPCLSSLYGSTHYKRLVEEAPSAITESNDVYPQSQLNLLQSTRELNCSLQDNAIEMENIPCQEEDNEKQVSSHDQTSLQILSEEKKTAANSNLNNNANQRSIKEFVMCKKTQDSPISKTAATSPVEKQNSNRSVQKQNETAQKNLLEIWRNAFCSQKSLEVSYENSKACNSTWSIPEYTEKSEQLATESSPKQFNIAPNKSLMGLPRPTLQSSSISTTSSAKPPLSKFSRFSSDSSVSRKSTTISQRDSSAKSMTNNESEVSSKEIPLQHLSLEETADHSSFYDDDSRELVIDENPPDSTYMDENTSEVTADKTLRKDCNAGNLTVKSSIANRDKEKQENPDKPFNESHNSKNKNKRNVANEIRHKTDGLTKKSWKKHNDKFKSKSTKHQHKQKIVSLENVLDDKSTSMNMTLKSPQSNVGEKMTGIDKQNSEDLIDSSTEQSSKISSPCNINESANQRKSKPIKIRIYKGKSMIVKEVKQTEKLPSPSESQNLKEIRAMYKCVVCDFKSDNFNDLQLHMLKLPCNDILLPNGSNETCAKTAETSDEAASTTNSTDAKSKKDDLHSLVSQEKQKTTMVDDCQKPSINNEGVKSNDASTSSECSSKSQEGTSKQKKSDTTKLPRRKRTECYSTSLVCNICSKAYNTKIDLANHIYKHTEIELQQAYQAAKIKLIKERLECAKALLKESKKDKESRTGSTTENPIKENQKTDKEAEQKKTDKEEVCPTEPEVMNKNRTSLEQQKDMDGSDSTAVRDEETTPEERLEQIKNHETSAESSNMDNITSQIESDADQQVNNGQETEMLSSSMTSSEDVSVPPQITKPITICECHNKEVTIENCLRIEIVLLCHVCQVLFRRMECLETHYRRAEGAICNKNRRHGRSPKLFCTNCRVIFGSILEVRQHLEMHARRNRTGVTDFRCNICKVIFIGIGSLFYVHWSCHVKDPFFLASKLSFPKSSIVDAKYFKTYNPSDKSDEVYIQVAEHICRVCKMPFGLSEELEKHERMCGNYKELAVATKDTDIGRSTKETHAVPDIRLICALCNAIFFEKSLFERHARLNHNQYSNPQYICVALTAVKKVYICNVCASVQESVADLEEHWSKHRQMNFTCVECEKHCDTLESFVEHTKEHNDKGEKREPPTCRVAYRDTKFICTTCGWTLSSETLLREHLLLHPQNLSTIRLRLDAVNEQQDSGEKNHPVSSVQETSINIEDAPLADKALSNLSNLATKTPGILALVQSGREGSSVSDYEVIVLDESSTELQSSKTDRETDAEEIKKRQNKDSSKPIGPGSTGGRESTWEEMLTNMSVHTKNDSKRAEEEGNNGDKEITLHDDGEVIKVIEANRVDNTQECRKNTSSLKETETENDMHILHTSTSERCDNNQQNDADKEAPDYLHVTPTQNEEILKKPSTNTVNTSEEETEDSRFALKNLSENIADSLASSMNQVAIEPKKVFLRVKTLAELTGGTPEYACQMCSLSFDSMDKLKQHSAIHDKDPSEAINMQYTPVTSCLVSTAATTDTISDATNSTQSVLQPPTFDVSNGNPQNEQHPTWHVCHSNPSSPVKPQNLPAPLAPQNQGENSSSNTITSPQSTAILPISLSLPPLCPIFRDAEPCTGEQDNTVTSQQSSTADVCVSNATTNASSSSNLTSLVVSSTETSKYNCAVCPEFHCNTISEFLLHEHTVEHETRKRSVQIVRLKVVQPSTSNVTSNTTNLSNVTMSTVPASAKPRVVDTNRPSSAEQIQNRGGVIQNMTPSTYRYRHIVPANNGGTQQGQHLRPTATPNSNSMNQARMPQVLRYPVWFPPPNRPTLPLPPPYTPRPEHRPPQPTQEAPPASFLVLRDSAISVNHGTANTTPMISAPQSNAAYRMVYTPIRSTTPPVQPPPLYVLAQNYQFTCPYCRNNPYFATEELLRNHFDMQHNFPCDICGQRMFNNNDLAVHRITHEIIWEANAFQNRNN
ncbi:hypothetical protein KM043_015860 [Ampulex compressa]|nr:hypothetical protein KM043_015860 [Ampulex compressa]